jgi:hypothetical protein
MELIHVDLSSVELVAGPGPVVVSHRTSELPRVLREGEAVLVSDRDGEFHSAVVLSAVGEEELAYELHIGARLPMDMAAQRLADVELTPEQQGLHEIVDLLGDLRRSEQVRPQP